jgi:5,5'-dehydrodivanillate O-demethylase oxygenase subunit
MLTAEQNETLTRVGPGTPMGTLLRRYWHPIAATVELQDKWTRRIRLLGEDLVLFRDRQGRIGLIGEYCPHRRASFAWGLPTQDGIRCPYHGWEFNGQGSCLDQPNEPPGRGFKDRMHVPAYPVQAMGGMLFAYLGPEPRPVLPPFDGFVVPGAIRTLGRTLLPVNWLQIMENSADPIHTEWLHGHHYEFQNEAEGAKVAISDHHAKIAFNEFAWGMTKHRLLEGQSEDSDDWKVGHPIVFPTMLAVGNGDAHLRSYAFQIRTPVDDEHTLHQWYNAYVPQDASRVAPHLLEHVHVYDVPYRDEHGELRVDTVDNQDMMAWCTQGKIADRTRENLGSTDQGVAMFRRMLRRELDRVQQGHDPLGTLRDPSVAIIDLPNERNKRHFSDGFGAWLMRTQTRYAPIAQDLIDIFERPVKVAAE